MPVADVESAPITAELIDLPGELDDDKEKEPKNRALFLAQAPEFIADERSIAPFDKLTELPLPIFYTRTDLFIKKRNYHHLRHPKKSAALGYDIWVDEFGATRSKLSENEAMKIEGKALRYSQGQVVPRYLHDRYHEIFKGSYLPIDRKDKFTGIVLALAGVTPRRALDLSVSGECIERELDDYQHRFLSNQKRMFFEKARGARPEEAAAKRDVIGRFFAAYALEQSIKLPPEIFDEFLNAEKEKQKQQLGRTILNEAIGISVADLIPLHKKAKDEGMISGKVSSLGAVVLKFFPQRRFPDYLAPLENQARTLVS